MTRKMTRKMTHCPRCGTETVTPPSNDSPWCPQCRGEPMHLECVACGASYPAVRIAGGYKQDHTCDPKRIEQIEAARRSAGERTHQGRSEVQRLNEGFTLLGMDEEKTD